MKSSESRGLVGLKNLGNTCYLNSVVQCVSRLKAVKAYCGQNPTFTGEVSNKFCKVVNMLHSHMDEVLLKEFKATIGNHNETFKGSSQEDAHEFLLYLLGCLQEDMTEASSLSKLPPPSEFFRNQFISQELQKVSCVNCDDSTEYYEAPTPVLSVALTNSRNPTLQECLTHHTNDVEDDIPCVMCGVSRRRRLSTFTVLPPSFIIQLKRFGFKDNRAFKDTRSVACPNDIVVKGTPYTLVGYVVHYGGLNRGHYIAFQKIRDKWFKFDDDVVSEVVDSVGSSDAYILFYDLKNKPKRNRFQTREKTSKPTHSSVQTKAESTVFPPLKKAKKVLGTPEKKLKSQIKEQLTLPSSSRPTQEDRTKENMTSENPNELPSLPFLSMDIDMGDELPGNQLECDTGGNSSLLLPAPLATYSEDEENAEEFLDDLGSSRVVCLTESDDVPGAVLDEHRLSGYLVHQLKRWLACRHLKLTGNKDELLDRIRNHIAAGQSYFLWPGIDGGKWLQMKEKGILARVGEEVLEEPLLPVVGWRIFPGYNIPKTFNEGHVYHFLVESVPTLSEISGKTFRTTLHDKPLTTVGTEKIYRRAQRLVDSGFVENVRDNMQHPRYFVKAYVRASMELKKYFVFVVLSPVSGSVLSTKCDECKASALGRCSHVAALLRYMVEHVESHGHDAITSTGRKREWGKGKTQRDPGPTVQARYYKKRKNVERRQLFDPRATAHKEYSYSPQQCNDLISVMQYRNVWWHPTRNEKLKKHQAWQDSLKCRYLDYEASEEDVVIVMEQCSQFCRNMYDSVPTHPYLIPGTEEQSESSRWHQARSLLITASIAKRVLGLSSSESRKRFLQEHLWGMLKFQGNKATRYGQENEAAAREEYNRYLLSTGVNAEIEETGLWISQEYPMLGCSPDAIVHIHSRPPKLLEIKCPYTLRDVDPSNFHTHLSRQQLRNYPLVMCPDGIVRMKKTHSHFYQIQMQMHVMNMKECDYMVWSQHGFTILTVEYDEEFWYPKREILKYIFNVLFVPEYFLMRTPRDLPPLEFEFGTGTC